MVKALAGSLAPPPAPMPMVAPGPDPMIVQMQLQLQRLELALTQTRGEPQVMGMLNQQLQSLREEREADRYTALVQAIKGLAASQAGPGEVEVLMRGLALGREMSAGQPGSWESAQAQGSIEAIRAATDVAREATGELRAARRDARGLVIEDIRAKKLYQGQQQGGMAPVQELTAEQMEGDFQGLPGFPSAEAPKKKAPRPLMTDILDPRVVEAEHEPHAGEPF